jgi:hypothetical protein
MAQVDKVSYLPLLFWFLVFFLIIYISVGFFYMPKTFATISIRVAFFKKLCRRFAKFYRQFKFNLRCLGAVELSELALASHAILLTLYRLPFLK